MKHIEVSKKITLSKNATQNDLKNALQERLQRSFKLSHVSEDKNGFTAHGVTHGAGGIIGHARVDLNVTIKKEKDSARIEIFGRSKMAGSLLFLYMVMFVLVLLMGLMPGAFETSAETSEAADVLIFLLVGVFAFYDLEKKTSAPKEYLESALSSLETEFG